MTISIVIPTKNRAQLLELCLTSLANQTIIPDEVIIIDNNSTDHTKLVIKKLSSTLSIIRCVSKKNNYPGLYNLGINKAQGNIIACLDDDCWVEESWVENIISAQKKHPKSVIQGRIISYPQNNTYARIMAQHYKHWLETHFLSDKTLSVLDTKNVSFPKKIIKNNLFATNLQLGSHDIELGKRLVSQNINIYYQENVIAHHKERTTFKDFISQHWRIAQSEARLNQYLPKQQTNLIFSQKNLKSLVWLIKLIAKQLSKLKIKQTIQIILLYLILIVIRVSGFVYSQVNKKSP
jgi:glycosyltransferase involved in cell wall biosynthesis